MAKEKKTVKKKVITPTIKTVGCDPKNGIVTIMAASKSSFTVTNDRTGFAFTGNLVEAVAAYEKQIGGVH